MRRREFITLLGGAAAWPLAAPAQQRERIRRIGVLMNFAADDPAGQARLIAFGQSLEHLGWTEGRNISIEVRWGASDGDRIRKSADELVALAPDVILSVGGPSTGPLLRRTAILPIVFVQVTDPVGAGFIENLAHPGGNATGFINFEYGTASKWLELLKQISPRVVRVAILRDPNTASGPGQLGALQAVASSMGVELTSINSREPSEIERGIVGFANKPNGALIVTAGGLVVHRDLIVALAARHQLPASYSDRIFVSGGGLMAYGPDRLDQYRRAASYVDRILKGEKPADLPVQAPTKYELVINLKVAKALGLQVPDSLLATADEVIE
jgi:putative tryptophan/tyrosine transport system substrate-binding protein